MRLSLLEIYKIHHAEWETFMLKWRVVLEHSHGKTWPLGSSGTIKGQPLVRNNVWVVEPIWSHIRYVQTFHRFVLVIFVSWDLCYVLNIAWRILNWIWRTCVASHNYTLHSNVDVRLRKETNWHLQILLAIDDKTFQEVKDVY